MLSIENVCGSIVFNLPEAADSDTLRDLVVRETLSHRFLEEHINCDQTWVLAVEDGSMIAAIKHGGDGLVFTCRMFHHMDQKPYGLLTFDGENADQYADVAKQIGMTAMSLRQLLALRMKDLSLVQIAYQVLVDAHPLSSPTMH